MGQFNFLKYPTEWDGMNQLVPLDDFIHPILFGALIEMYLNDFSVHNPPSYFLEIDSVKI